MTHEEFQRLLLQRLDSIDKKLNKLDSVAEQTASLTEFNNELTEKLDRVIEQTALLAGIGTKTRYSN